MVAVPMEGIALALLQQHRDAARVAALLGVVLVTWWALGVIKWAVRWIRVAVGTRQVPSAPGGNALLGHVIPLAPPNCAWEKMYEWLQKSAGGILKVRILNRTGILVGNPQAMKRIFQVGRRSAGGQGAARAAPHT